LGSVHTERSSFYFMRSSKEKQIFLSFLFLCTSLPEYKI